MLIVLALHSHHAVDCCKHNRLDFRFQHRFLLRHRFQHSRNRVLLSLGVLRLCVRELGINKINSTHIRTYVRTYTCAYAHARAHLKALILAFCTNTQICSDRQNLSVETKIVGRNKNCRSKQNLSVGTKFVGRNKIWCFCEMLQI